MKTKAKRQPFNGVAHNDPMDEPVAANRDAEIALVHLVWTADGMLGDLLQRLPPQDFYYADCRFIYSECVAMCAGNQPVTDKAAQVSWFKRPEVIHRMKQAKLHDWFDVVDGQEQPIAAAAIFETVVAGHFAALAHLEWYVLELRRWRVVRGLRLLAMEISRKADETESLEVLEWLGRSLVQLQKLAEPLKAATVAAARLVDGRAHPHGRCERGGGDYD
jgi:hypothetical protein